MNPRTTRNGSPAAVPLIRCAVYTRKSTEEGLEQEFNSLDAQRESGEACVRSQQHEGWVCLPDRYDDGGFTGGNMERPALRRLFADIEAGKVDCVVVYKVDRLSRSLLDFARMMETFDKHRVAFVSVTQQFNTATSMGRLVLNVLLSFAQFEREIISERTRDKIAATRRRGKWAGGYPLLGLDIDPRGNRLLVNEEEAARVRAIFDLYLQHQALLPVVLELDRRKWTNKRWATRAGPERGGLPFTKTSLHRLLTNVLYAGKVRYKTEVHPGEQAAIIDPATFQRVQELLHRNGATGGAHVRNQFGALLKGLLRCAPCGCAMTPSITTRNQQKRYRYYTCTRAQKKGWHVCPSKSIPASEIERVVLDQVRKAGKDPAVLAQTLTQLSQQDEARIAELEAEQRTLTRDLARWHAEARRLAPTADREDGLARLAEVEDRIRLAEGHLGRVRDQLYVLRRSQVDEAEAAVLLSRFDPVWEVLTPVERARVVQLLVQAVDYDGRSGKVKIVFHPDGVRALAREMADEQGKEQTA